MRLAALIVITASLLASSCGPVMTRTERSAGPLEGMALVTFLNPFEVGDRTSFELWDGDRFIGELSTGTLIDYQAEAGEHYFLAKGANWSALRGTLAAGRRYYVLARPAVSSAEVAVVLEPATLDAEGSELTRWLSRLSPLEVVAEKAEKHASFHAREARRELRRAREGEVYVRSLE